MEKKNEKEVLLKVDHLCQYFKIGHQDLKAVDDVSFDVYKGEVFGLVGESGCGKTTTGRTIIKLYEATKGDVVFDGTRISAGIRGFKENIKKAKADYKKFVAETNKKISELEKDLKSNSESIKSSTDDLQAREAHANSIDSDTEKLEELRVAIKTKASETKEYIAAQKEEIKKAIYDNKNCNKEYQEEHIKIADEKYLPKIQELQEKGDVEELKKVKAEYKYELSKAKKSRLVNQIQMIFQDPIASLDPRMTVQDIISEGLIIKGIKDKAEIQEKVYKMLELVGLVKEHATRYPHEFSGGQRQRIGVARAIIMEPKLIIADEPVSALDVSIQAQVINLLNDLRDSMGLTIMFIAHDLSVVKFFSDRIGVMYFGKLVELAPSDELFLNPLHPYTKALLSAIPLPDPIYEKKRKRIIYNPLRDHDYSVEGPSMKEIKPGHLIYCNSKEFEEYKKTLK